MQTSKVENLESTDLVLLSPSEYSIAVPFFLDLIINEPLLYAILEQRNPGRVFTNDRKNPSYVLVYSPASYTYLAGKLDQSSLQNIATYLKTLPKISLICPLEWEYRSFFEEAGFIAVERIQLRRPDKPFLLESWKKCLSAHYSVEEISHKNFDLCAWRAFMLNLYGTKEHFCTNEKGFCIVDQEKVISESFAIIGKGKAEIAVITHENYRGQNLGTIISAFMVHYCHHHGLEPLWSCDASNQASASIAKKLGFVEECRYFFLKHQLNK